jgi:biopolymer transport protein ExbD
MAVKISQGRVLAALSLTPMIDVVFLLLIFFLVASRLSQEDRELPIPLPSAANAMPMTIEPQELIVNIDQHGSIIVLNEVLDREGFERKLRQTLADNPLGQNVIIRADRRVSLQIPVDVMDTCLKLGAVYSLVAEEIAR